MLRIIASPAGHVESCEKEQIYSLEHLMVQGLFIRALRLTKAKVKLKWIWKIVTHYYICLQYDKLIEKDITGIFNCIT